MEENSQQFNLSDFGIDNNPVQQQQFSISDFGLSDEELKTLPSAKDKTSAQLVNEEYDLKSINLDKFISNNPDLQDISELAKVKLEQKRKDSLIKASKQDKTILEKNLFELMGMKSDYQPKQVVEEDKGLPTAEKQGLEYPSIDPLFAGVGALSGKAVGSVAGDVGGEMGVKVFDYISKTLTPELEKENPMLYGALAAISGLAGGVTAGKLGQATAETVGKVPMATAGATGDYLKDPSFVKNIIKGTASDKQSLDYLITRSGETEDSLKNIYSSYAKGLDKATDSLTEADKIKAIISNTNVGARVKLDAEYFTQGVLSKQNNLEEQLRGILKEKTHSGDFDIPSLELKQYLTDSSGLYGQAKDALIKYSNNSIKLDTKLVDELEQSLTKGLYSADNISTVSNIIKDLKNPDGLDVEQLLEMKKTLNGLDLSSTKAFKAGTVGTFLDNMVKKSIGDDAYHLWEEVNKRYASKKLMEEDNDIVKLLNARLDGTYTDKVFSEKILNMDKAGYKYFNMLRDAIGEKEASKVELGIVKTMLDSKTDMSKIIDNVNNFGFSTVEGRSILANLDKVKGLVTEDEAKGLLSKAFGLNKPNVGWSDDLAAKARYWIVGRAWNTLMKRLPANKEDRALTNIGEILKNDTLDITMDIKKDELYNGFVKARERDLRLRIDALEQQGRNRTVTENKELMKAKQEMSMIEEGLDNMPKQIEYKPKDFIVTPSGKAMSADKQDVADTVMTAEKLVNELGKRAEGKTSYNPKGQFQDTKASGRQTIEGEVIDTPAPKTLPNNTKDNIIDVEVVDKIKTMKPEQQSRYNNIIDKEINPLQKEIDRLNTALSGVDNQAISKNKKDNMRKAYEAQIKANEAKMVTLKNKLPK